MDKVLKNKKLVLFGLLITLSIISLLFIFGQVSNNKAPTPTPRNSTQANYNSIVPGVSTKEEAIKKLGKPLNTDPNLLNFKSSSTNRNNQVVINQDKVSLIKEVVTLKDTKTVADITNVYGVAQKVLYGPDADAGFYLFVYPSNGIAYLGHPESGLLLEIRYFPPTDLSSFEENYAKGYSETFQEPGPESFN